MVDSGVFHSAETYGLGIVLSIGVFGIMFFLLKWVLSTSKDMLAQMGRRKT